MKHEKNVYPQLAIVVIAILFFDFTSVSAETPLLRFVVEGRGFHRTLKYFVHFQEFYKENCYVALHYVPNPMLYVDVNELANLRRLGTITACSNGEIDVELFAEKAQLQQITVCEPLVKPTTVLSLPFHQRYQLPGEDEYVNITAPVPSLLIGCESQVPDWTVSKINLCSPCVHLSRKWRDVPFVLMTPDYIWKIPVGNIAESETVHYFTLLSVFFGAITTLIVISNSIYRS